MSDSGDDLRALVFDEATTRCTRRSRTCRRSSAGSAPAAPRRPRREAEGRLLRRRGPAAAARRLLGPRAARARDLALRQGRDQGDREGDPGERPRGQPVQRRAGHPARVPRAHRRAAQGAREGREEPGGGRPGRGAQRPPPDAPGARALEKDGELSRDDLDRIEKELEKLTHTTVAEIDTMSGTRRRSSSRCDRLP